MHHSPALVLSDIAASSGSLTERGRSMVQHLRTVASFDAAWLALVDPVDGRYRPLLALDLDDATHEYLAGPKMAGDIEATQTNRARPSLSPSDLPYPAEELDTWAECLLPAGFHEALAVGLFIADRRHIGFLALLSQTTRPPTPSTRNSLQLVNPILGRDPLRSLAVSAHAVQDASAGAALCRDGSALPLPGLPGDGLLTDGSPVTAVSRSYLADGQAFASFLWPRGDVAAPDGHVRVSVLASPANSPDGLVGAIVLAPAGDVHGLTPRELEVLGMLTEGLSNQQIAHALVIGVRTVATHLEHILVKLDAPSRTLAAVRAQRLGLYVPSPNLRP